MINKKIDEISAKLETIKVLVQDNEYLENIEKRCDEVNKINQTLENRIQKAIEYIKQCEWEDYDDDTPAEEKQYSIEVIKLLDILKGGKNESN